MTLLNIGCGATRPGPPWINIDCLHTFLKPGTPERINLDAETNYMEHNLPWPLPLQASVADGILISHVIEHFDCMEAVRILADCHRLLKPGGLLVVSVPDAEYFLKVYRRDTPENAVELFGEPINLEEANTFFDYGLWFYQHKQIFCEATLNCTLLKAGFKNQYFGKIKYFPHQCRKAVEQLMNRRKFSLEVCATTAPSATSGASAP